MRLFLHGRSDKTILLGQLDEAGVNERNYCKETCPSLNTTSNMNNHYSTLLLSNWDMNVMDEDVVISLETFLRKQDQQSHKQKRQRQEQPCDEVCTSMSSISSQDALILQDGDEIEDIQQKEQGSCSINTLQREVILHNCTGHEKLEQLIVLLMDTVTSIIIRYDKQKDFPIHVAKGLHQGANTIYNGDFAKENDFCQLQSLTLKGMTITPSTANYLHFALPLLPNLEELTIQGKFTLIELDRNKSSIAGDTRLKSIMADVAVILHKVLRELPQLKLLDLQQCHLPDEYLAYVLEGLCHPFQSIETLKLKGNKVNEESQNVLCYQILSRTNCRLQHLDLSWQRLPFSKRVHSIFDTTMIADVLGNKNTSLKTLDLSENRLLDEDVAQLAMAISRHPALGKVVLQNCHMTDQGVIELANRLPKCSESLKSLFVDGKQKIKKGKLVREEIFTSLLKNVYLQELGLPDCCKSNRIDLALEFNHAGRRALSVGDETDCIHPAIECTIRSAPSFDSQHSSSEVSDALWPTVLERADRIARQKYCHLNEKESSTSKAASAIYLLLREKGYQSLLQ